jgi:hypothetical protein
MYLMFVDESGDPGFPKDGEWTSFGGSRYFVRVGVVIHGWKWRAWHQGLKAFKTARHLAWATELKASHIRRGCGEFSGQTEASRRQLMLDLAHLIGRTRDFTLLGVVIEKSKVDSSLRDRFSKPQVRSLELLLERYNWFLATQRDRAGIVVLDPVNESSDDNLRRFQSYLLDQEPRFQPFHIVEGTFFAKSHTSNMSQMADICSNILYAHVAGGQDSPEWKAIAGRFWRPGGRLSEKGLKFWPDHRKSGQGS